MRTPLDYERHGRRRGPTWVVPIVVLVIAVLVMLTVFGLLSYYSK